MRYRKAAGAALAVACLFGAATGSATAAEQPRTASSSGTTSTTATQTAANPADVEFVTMMIPHHYQAVVMGDLASDRAGDEDVRKLAERIAVEQTVEISTMQGWQAWNGLPVTDAQQAYEDMLEQPEMLEQMGMATPAEMDQLSASQGTAFDVLFLQLMIPHHEGAVDMAVDVLTHGTDPFLQQMATDILTTQYLQIQQMEAMLADLTS